MRPVPPALSTAVPGSFARDTLARRVPEILAQTRRGMGALTLEQERGFDELGGELSSGGLRGLRAEAADRAFWDRAVTPFLGRSWLDLPWYFAEAYFYRRLLEATGYFGRGPGAGRDPFAAQKTEEWAPQEGPARLLAVLEGLPQTQDPLERLSALLAASLWGNRADLSYNVARTLGAYSGQGSDLLVDHRSEVLAFFSRRRPRRITVIADNAGTELLMDLALVDHLLGGMEIERVEMHVKDHPFFVSDTIAADLPAAQAALTGAKKPALADLQSRVDAWLAAGRLVVASHPFYTSSLHYPELPADLAAELGRADLVILKGDANYRRLCSDAAWPPETPFSEVVAGFPAPLCTLRTLKAEVIVGLPPGLAAHLSEQDPSWMVNGRRGVIQAHLRL